MFTRMVWGLLLIVMLNSCGTPTQSIQSAPPAPMIAATTEIPSATVPHTEVVRYVPTALTTTPRSGSCWGPSIAVYRDGAYRCMANDEIFDPCFALNNVPLAVICEPDPTTNDTGIQVNLTAPLPAVTNLPEPGHSAWLVELPGGLTCTPFTGTVAQVNDQPITYHCAGQYDQEQTVLLGKLTIGEQWTATQAIISPGNAEPQLKKAETVVLQRVWQ